MPDTAAAAPPLLRSPFQISFVVPDLEAAMQVWWEVYGVGPWEVFSFERGRIEDATVDGEPRDFGMRIAMTHWGPLELELIQPLDESQLSRSLAEHGGRAHFHHLQCHVEDYDRTLEFLAARDAHAHMSGRIGEVRFSYVGTEGDIGAIVEIAARPDDWDWPRSDAVYPPA